MNGISGSSNRECDTGVADETSRLLEELDQAIDRCDAIRDIARRWERLHDMECVIGPSRQTRILRKEIMLLEKRIRGRDCGRSTSVSAPLPST